MNTHMFCQHLMIFGIIYNQACFADEDWHFLGQNIALHKPVNQSPGTYREHVPYSASLAVDGDNDTDFGAGSCSHTSKGKLHGPASLTIILGKKFNITGIVIFNRQDHRNRLQDFVVLGNKVVVYNDTGIQAYGNSVIRIPVDGLNSYSSITVQIPGHTGDPDNGYTYLTLCEVQVYASPPACPPVLLCPKRGHQVAIYGNSGRIVNNKNTVGTVIQFTCRLGYHIRGLPSIECLSTGQYNSPIPICIQSSNDNSDGKNITYYTWYNETEFLHYYRSIYVCVKGYQIDYHLIWKTCGSNSSLIAEEVVCRKIQCPYPDKLQNGGYFNDNGSTYYSGNVDYDTVVFMACNNGHVADGQVKRRCRADGTWEGNLISCKKVTCGHPSDFVGGSYLLGNDTNPYANGSQTCNTVITVKCAKGYILNSTSKERECLETGSWSGETPVCMPVMCPWPLRLNGGYYIPSLNQTIMGLPFDTNLTAKCNDSSRLASNSNLRRCNESGMWENEQVCCSPDATGRGHKVFFFVTGVASAFVILLVILSIIINATCKKLKSKADEELYTDLDKQLREHSNYDQLRSICESEICVHEMQESQVLEGHINEVTNNDVTERAKEAVNKEVVEWHNKDVVEEVLSDLRVPQVGVYFIPENERQEENCYCNTELDYQNCQSTV